MGQSWNHIIASHSDNGLNLFLNGKVTTMPLTGLGSYSPAQASTIIGGNFEGALDEIALYSSSLPAARVLSHYYAAVGDPSVYKVQLESEPVASVTVDIHPFSNCYRENLCNVSVSPTSLVFSPTNWNSSQTVRVNAINDDLDESSTHLAVISHSARSATDACRYTGGGQGGSSQCRKYNRYNQIGIHNVSAYITDNDVSFVNISQSVVFVSEDGLKGSYSITLLTEPWDDVVIKLSSTDACYRKCDRTYDTGLCSSNSMLCNFTVTPSEVKFTPENWGAPQSVELSAIDDLLDEGFRHDSLVTYSSESSDGKYNNIDISSTVVNIIDNDNSGVSLSSPFIAIAEGGYNGMYSIYLDTEPWDSVTIDVSTANGCYRDCGLAVDPKACGNNLGRSASGKLCNATIYPQSIIFTTSNWKLSQNVSVFATDDHLDEADYHLSLISHSTHSSDTRYNSVAVANATLNITDNDNSDILIYKELPSGEKQQCPCILEVKEGSFTDEYKFVLNSEPYADVTIRIIDWGEKGYRSQFLHVNATADTAAFETQITFTPMDWSVPKGLIVIPLNDDTEEPAVSAQNQYHIGKIYHSSQSSDDNYNNMVLPNNTAHITENGNSSIDVSVTNVTVSEAGQSAVYSISIATEPWSDVTVKLYNDSACYVRPGSNFTQCNVTITPNELVFTKYNWNSSQSVTVEALDDYLDEHDIHPYTIYHLPFSSDLVYARKLIANVTANIIDNDKSEVLFSHSQVNIRECRQQQLDAGQLCNGMYTVTLRSQPWADTTVRIKADHDCYRNGLGDAVLFRKPFLCNATAKVTATGKSIIEFSTKNWNMPQFIEVVAVDDDLDEEQFHMSRITHDAVGNDMIYSDLQLNTVNVRIEDNDESQVLITTFSLQSSSDDTAIVRVNEDPALDEDPQYKYKISLSTEPYEDVTVTVRSINTKMGSSVVGLRTPVDQADPSVPKNSYEKKLVFTVFGWDQEQVITVNAVDDNFDELVEHSDKIVHTVASSDSESTKTSQSLVGGYNGLTNVKDVQVKIGDNDVSTVFISSFIKAANLNGDTYTGPDGELLEKITHDEYVKAKSIVNLNVKEAGIASHYDVVLLTQPKGVTDLQNAVAVTPKPWTGHCMDPTGKPFFAIRYSCVSNDDCSTLGFGSKCQNASKVVISPSIIKFSYYNWNIPQRVTVTAIDDSMIEEPFHIGMISHSSSSSDKAYDLPFPNCDGLTFELCQLTRTNQIEDVYANITDNDVAQVIIDLGENSKGLSKDALYVTEGMRSDSYGISLGTQPWADVDVQVTWNQQQMNISDSSLKFSPQNWNVKQYVTAIAVDDDFDEPKPSFTSLQHTCTSKSGSDIQDSNYNDIQIDSTTVSIMDNDFAGFSLRSQKGVHFVSVAEGGFDDTFTLALTSQPNFPVTFSTSTPNVTLNNTRTNFSASTEDNIVTYELFLNTPQVYIIPSIVEFTPENWNIPQTVTVRGVVDDMKEGGNHFAKIFSVSSSNDKNYNGSWMRSVSCSHPNTSTRVFAFEDGKYNHPDQKAVFKIGKQVVSPIQDNCGDDCCPLVGVPVINVEISEDDLVPAPVLEKSIFSNTAATITVRFDSTTDKGGFTAAADCKFLFDGIMDDPEKGAVDVKMSTLEALGNNNLCAWKDQKTVTVTLGDSAKIMPGDFLKLKDKSVKSRAAATLTSSGSVKVEAPLDPPVPRAVIIGGSEKQLGLCDNLILDASLSSGGGGRKLTFSWSIIASSTAKMENISKIVNATNNEYFGLSKGIGNPVLTIEKDLLVAGVNYFATVSLNNIWGSKTANVSQSITKISYPIPPTRILGESLLEVVRSQQIIIRGEGISPQCDPTDKPAPLSFFWFDDSSLLNLTEYSGKYGVQGGHMTIATNTKNDRNFKVKKNALEVAKTYVFRMVAAMTENTNINNSASVTLYVKADKIKARIEGGSRQLGSDYPLILDGGISSDPDNINIAEMYSWTCRQFHSGTLHIPCKDAFDNIVVLPMIKKIVIPNDTLSVNHTYEFTLKFSKGIIGQPDPYGLREDSAAVNITILKGSPPKVQLTPPVNDKGEPFPSDTLQSLLYGQSVAKVNPNQKFVIQAAAISKAPLTLSSKWAAFDANGVEMNLQQLSLTSIFDKLEIALKPNVFTADAVYTFRISATDVNGVAFASTKVYTNNPPTSGVVTVTNEKTGETHGEVGDKFIISCQGWIDDFADFPLTYSYQQISGKDKQIIITDPDTGQILGVEAVKESPLVDDYLKSNKLLAVLPQGPEEEILDPNTNLPVLDGDGKKIYSFTITVVVYIRDKLGAETRKAEPVEVSPLGDNVDPLAFVQNISLADLATNGDPAINLQTLNLMSGVLKPKPSTDAQEQVFSSLKMCEKSKSEPEPEDCSGHGVCISYKKPQTEPLITVDSCKLTDGTCDVLCQCETGYSGSGCEYSDAALNARIDTRDGMMGLLLSSGDAVEESAQSTNQLLGSTSSLVGSPQEVGTDSGLKALSSTANLVARTNDPDGPALNSNAAAAAAGGLSSLVSPSSPMMGENASATQNGRRRLLSSHEVNDAVSSMVSTVGNIGSATLKSTTAGEPATEVSSENIQIMGKKDSSFEGEQSFGKSPQETAARRRRRRRMISLTDAESRRIHRKLLQQTTVSKPGIGFPEPEPCDSDKETDCNADKPVKRLEAVQYGLDIHKGKTTEHSRLRRLLAAATGNPVNSGLRSSDTLGISFYSDSGVKEQTVVTTPFIIKIPVNNPVYDGNFTQKCTYFNETTLTWSTDGCWKDEENSTATMTVCKCLHLTDFSSELSNVFANSNFAVAANPSVINLKNISENPIPFAVLVGLVVIYIVVAFLGHRQDNISAETDKADRLKEMLWKKSKLRFSHHQPSDQNDWINALGAAGETQAKMRVRKPRSMNAVGAVSLGGRHSVGHSKAKRKIPGFMSKIPGRGLGKSLPLPQSNVGVENEAAGEDDEKKQSAGVCHSFFMQWRKLMKWYHKPSITKKIQTIHVLLDTCLLTFSIGLMAVGFDLWFALGFIMDSVIQNLFGTDIGPLCGLFGIALLVTSLFGYFSALRHSHTALQILITVLVLALLAQLTIGALLFRVANDLEKYPAVDNTVRSRWKALPGKVKEETQSSFGCCGYRNVHDLAYEPCPEEATIGCTSFLQREALGSTKILFMTAFIFCSLQVLLLLFSGLLLERKNIKKTIDEEQANAMREIEMERERFLKKLYHFILAIVNTLIFASGLVLAATGVDEYFAFGFASPVPVQHMFGHTTGLSMGIVGIILTIISVVGIYIRTHPSSKMVAIYLALMCTTVLVQVGASVFVLKVANELQLYPGFDDIVSDAWDSLSGDNRELAQQYFKCCGLRNELDRAFEPCSFGANACKGPIMNSRAETSTPIAILALVLSGIEVVAIILPIGNVYIFGKRKANDNGVKKLEQHDDRLPPARGIIRVAQVLLVVINCIFILAALFMLTIGIDMLSGFGLLTPGPVEFIIADSSSFAFALILLGSGALLVSMLGLYGAGNRDKCTLAMYFSLVAIVFIGQTLLGLGLWKASEDFKVYSLMDEQVRNAYSKLDFFTRDRAQKYLQCCGYENATDLPLEQSRYYPAILSTNKLNGSNPLGSIAANSTMSSFALSKFLESYGHDMKTFDLRDFIAQGDTGKDGKHNTYDNGEDDTILTRSEFQTAVVRDSNKACTRCDVAFDTFDDDSSGLITVADAVIDSRVICPVETKTIVNATHNITIEPKGCKTLVMEAASGALIPIAVVTLTLAVVIFGALVSSCMMICKSDMTEEEKARYRKQRLNALRHLLSSDDQHTDGNYEITFQEKHPTVTVGLQTVLIVLHSAFCLGGFLILLLGIDLAFGLGYSVKPAISSLLGPSLGGGLAAIALVVLLTSGVGLYGAIKRSPFALLIYMGIVTAIIFAEIAIAAGMSAMSSKFKDKQKLDKMGRTAWKGLSMAQKSLAQRMFACCGYENITDLAPRMSLGNTSTVFCTAKPTVPYVIGNTTRFTQVGCKAQLLNSFTAAFYPLLALTTSLAIFQVFAVLTSFMLSRKRKHAYDRELESAQAVYGDLGSRWIQRIKEEHTVISIPFVTKLDFTRPQRATAILVKMLCDLAASAAFFGTGSCSCPADPVTNESPEFCPDYDPACGPPSIGTKIGVGVITSLMTTPAIILIVLLFKKSANRRVYDNAKVRKEKHKMARITKRKKRAEKMAGQKKVKLRAKKQGLLGKIKETIQAYIIFFKVKVLKQEPPDYDLDDAETRGRLAARLAVIREEKSKKEAERQFLRDQKRKKYPNWLYSPGSIRFYKRFLSFTNAFFFLVAWLIFGFGIDLSLGLGYSFTGTEKGGGAIDMYGKYIGYSLVILGSILMLSCILGWYGTQKVPRSEDARKDLKNDKKRRKALAVYAGIIGTTAILLYAVGAITFRTAREVEYRENFASYVEYAWNNTALDKRAVAQITFTCCEWDTPSYLSMQELIDSGKCPDESTVGCRVKMMEAIGAMFYPFSLGALGGAGLITLCVFFAGLIITHQNEDSSDADFVFYRGGGGHGLFPKQLNRFTTDEYGEKMSSLLKNQKEEADFMSDIEEHKRKSDRLKGMFAKADEKGKGKGKGKRKGSMKKLGEKGIESMKSFGDQGLKLGKSGKKKIVEKARDTIAMLSRKRLQQIKDAEEKHKKEEEKLKRPSPNAPFPWWILHVNYFIAFIVCAGAIYFNLTFAFTFGVEISKEYLSLWGISVAMQFIVSEPLSILVKMVVLPYALGEMSGMVASTLIDIGMGAASGVGAVGFADRMIDRRRENAAIKAQAAFRGAVSRRLAKKMEAQRRENREVSRSHRANQAAKRAKNPRGDTLRGQKISLFKVASALAHQKTVQQSAPFDLRTAIKDSTLARKGLRAGPGSARKGKPIRPRGGPKRPTSRPSSRNKRRLSPRKNANSKKEEKKKLRSALARPGGASALTRKNVPVRKPLRPQGQGVTEQKTKDPTVARPRLKKKIVRTRAAPKSRIGKGTRNPNLARSLNSKRTEQAHKRKQIGARPKLKRKTPTKVRKGKGSATPPK
jgi:hypothetical protein